MEEKISFHSAPEPPNLPSHTLQTSGDRWGEARPSPVSSVALRVLPSPHSLEKCALTLMSLIYQAPYGPLPPITAELDEEPTATLDPFYSLASLGWKQGVL